MYNPISDYALIGDTHTTALIARDGSIDWLCWPRHDSPALFLRLLDDETGGSCTVAFRDLTSLSRRYLPGTNVLETTFTTATGRARLVDLMPVDPPDTEPDEGPDGDGEDRLIRMLTCEAGRVEGGFRVHPTPDYARGDCIPVEDRGCVLFEAGAQRLRVVASHPLAVAGWQAAEARFALGEGETAYLVLTHGEDEARAGVADFAGAQARLDRTIRYWERWSARCTYRGPYREAVLRSALCLKLLTYAPSGGMVAAATAGLPEAVQGNRNYDYRFTWMRDASFTVTAFVALGYVREAAEFLRFLREADGSRGRDVRLMYGIDGDTPGEETLAHLKGWRGVGPVVIGNEAESQTQHDMYGELLFALCAFLDAVKFDPPKKVNDHLPEVLENLTSRAIRSRDEPDHGIWEMRTEKRQQFHTKAMLWVALTHAAHVARHVEGVDAERITEWDRTAAEIRAEYLERGWNAKRQAYTQAYGSDDLDAAVMRVVLFGAIDPDDPRLLSTLAAIDRELVVGDLVYRYRMDDGMEGEEATFTACAFWRVGCLALTGRTREAKEAFERLIARGNDVGLFAEEIDAQTGEQRGNTPQGFTHMALINAAIRLDGCIAALGLRDEGAKAADHAGEKVDDV